MTLHVLFKVAGGEYALAASEVMQMESYVAATPVPGTLPYVAGVIQVRGRVVPVVDLRARFGLAPGSATLDQRVVVIEKEERTVGLLVDSAREVLELSTEQVRTPPQLMRGEGREGFVSGVAHVGNRLLMLVDVDRVIGEDTHHDR